MSENSIFSLVLFQSKSGKFNNTELQSKYVALNSFQGRKIERLFDAEINSARRSVDVLIAIHSEFKISKARYTRKL